MKQEEIDWAAQYKKELEDMRELVAVMADAILMNDAYEAHECAFDNELYEKAIELAEMFSSDALFEHKKTLEEMNKEPL
jgi:hypothetical protein